MFTKKSTISGVYFVLVSNGLIFCEILCFQWHYLCYYCWLFQGCMNNITFGDGEVGYYETVAGGAGAVSLTLTKQ